MKLSRKFLLTLACAALLVVGTALGTLAYFTDADADTNTFTVGKVTITLDEAKVNEDGTPVSGADRVTKNEYHLLPGGTYTKDPTIHVSADSSDCWVYVKVDNGLSAIEAADNTVEAQMLAKGWVLIDKENCIYAYPTMVAQDAANKDVEVFDSFTIDGDAVNNTTLKTYENAKISVIAYAIQADGFDTAQVAWETANGAFNEG